MILSILPDANSLKIGQITPYGYQIDFVLYLDRNRKPVPVPQSDDTNVYRNLNK